MHAGRGLAQVSLLCSIVDHSAYGLDGPLQLHDFSSDGLNCARHITLQPRLKCGISFIYYLQRMTMHETQLFMFRQSSRLRWAPSPSLAISNEITKYKNLDNFGTLCADSKHIGNSTSDMLPITHNVIFINPSS